METALQNIESLLAKDAWKSAVELALQIQMPALQMHAHTLQSNLRTAYEAHLHYYKIGSMNQLDYLNDRHECVSLLEELLKAFGHE